MKNSLPRKQFNGFGLVELMLGLFLGTVLLSLMTRHYLLIKQHSNATTNTLAKAYDKLLIGELLRKSIHHAGFTPCAPLHEILGPQNPGNATYEVIALPGKNNKALQIARMSEVFSLVTQIISASQWVVSSGFTMKPNEKVMVADCFHAEVQTIQSVRAVHGGTQISFKKSPHYHYVSPVYIGAWLEEQFYIHSNTKGQRAFYYRLGNHAELLSTFIDTMTVKPITQDSNRQLLRIDFGFEHGEAWHLNLAARG
jgi:hypothetical protein